MWSLHQGLGTNRRREIRSRDVRETNPKGLTYAVAARYEGSGQNKPNSVIFRAIYGLQRKSVPFFPNLNADSIKDSSYPTCNLCVKWKSIHVFSKSDAGAAGDNEGRGYGDAGGEGLFSSHRLNESLAHPACGIPLTRKRARAVVN